MSGQPPAPLLLPVPSVLVEHPSRDSSTQPSAALRSRSISFIIVVHMVVFLLRGYAAPTGHVNTYVTGGRAVTVRGGDQAMLGRLARRADHDQTNSPVWTTAPDSQR